MTYRPPQKDDQKKAEEAYCLLEDFFLLHPEIEGAIFAGGMFTHIAENFQESGGSHEDFCSELDELKVFYKYLWNNDKE